MVEPTDEASDANQEARPFDPAGELAHRLHWLEASDAALLARPSPRAHVLLIGRVKSRAMPGNSAYVR